MAGKKSGKWTRVFVEGYELSANLTAVGPTNAGAKIEVGGYTEDMNHLVGRLDAAYAIDGFFNDATGFTHDAQRGVTSGDTTHIVSILHGDNATPIVGDVSQHLKATQHTYDVTPDLNGFVAVHAEYGAKGYGIEYGVVLADATITANGQQSSVDQAASSSAGGVGFFHITGLSAGDTITILIEDSTDDAAWSTLITCTLDGTAIDAERVAVAGTVNRYVRASYTVTGASISFPIAVGFIRL